MSRQEATKRLLPAKTKHPTATTTRKLPQSQLVALAGSMTCAHVILLHDTLHDM